MAVNCPSLGGSYSWSLLSISRWQTDSSFRGKKQIQPKIVQAQRTFMESRNQASGNKTCFRHKLTQGLKPQGLSAPALFSWLVGIHRLSLPINSKTVPASPASRLSLKCVQARGRVSFPGFAAKFEVPLQMALIMSRNRQ